MKETIIRCDFGELHFAGAKQDKFWAASKGLRSRYTRFVQRSIQRAWEMGL